MNATCPFCKENTLVGGIREITWGVPLYEDGHDTIEGSCVEAEVFDICCDNCEKAVRPSHYYSHEYNSCNCEEVHNDNL